MHQCLSEPERRVLNLVSVILAVPRPGDSMELARVARANHAARGHPDIHAPGVQHRAYEPVVPGTFLILSVKP